MILSIKNLLFCRCLTIFCIINFSSIKSSVKIVGIVTKTSISFDVNFCLLYDPHICIIIESSTLDICDSYECA